MGNNLKLYDMWKRQSHEILNDLYHEIYGALQPLPRKRREIIWKLDSLILGHGKTLYNTDRTEVIFSKKELEKRAVSVLNHKNFILRFKLQGVVLTCTEYYKIQSIRNLIESNEHFFVEIKGNEVFFKKEISLGDETFNQPYILTITHFSVKDLQQKFAESRYTREQLELII